MPKNKDINSDDRKGDLFGSSSGSSDSKLPKSFDEIFGRLKLVFGVETDTDFARCMGFKQGSVSGAKQKKAIPPAWITEVALSKGVSADWLLTGEGEMRREGGAKFANVTQTRELMEGRKPESRRIQWKDAAPAALQASIYNDTSQQSGIADLVAKTIDVLQSNTVFETALKSNIEAFHRAIVLEKQIDQVEDRIMAKIGGRLDALESSNQQLQTENAQLHAENKAIRHELEESRAASAIRDTG
jgi:hypothetical protein